MSLTATMNAHLLTAVSQELAAASSDAYSAGITRAGFNRLGTLLALERRGLLSSSVRSSGLTAFSLTRDGWEAISSTARTMAEAQIADAEAQIARFAGAPGLVAMAEREIAGAKQIVSKLDTGEEQS